MTDYTPSIILIAGPNGAGKTTAAPILLRDTLQVSEYVNADTIALGLSAFAPETTALKAGRIMLERLHELAEARRTFAFETTLASRSFAPWIARQKGAGYLLRLLFLYLSSPNLAYERVAARVRLGGHDVPEEVIRRRYRAGLQNFFTLYRPLADGWSFFDNSEVGAPRLIAAQAVEGETRIVQPQVWKGLEEIYRG